jgi:hypothetical protein
MPVGGWDDVLITELLDLLNILGILVELAPEQHAVLDSICQAPRIPMEELIAIGAVPASSGWDGPLLPKRPHDALPL